MTEKQPRNHERFDEERDRLLFKNTLRHIGAYEDQRHASMSCNDLANELCRRLKERSAPPSTPRPTPETLPKVSGGAIIRSGNLLVRVAAGDVPTVLPVIERLRSNTVNALRASIDLLKVPNGSDNNNIGRSTNNNNEHGPAM